MKNLTPDQFISQLYREAPLIPLSEFSQWALDLLRYVIPFDGAIWGTGHLSTQSFHTQTSLDVSPALFDRLLKYNDINPIFARFFTQSGVAIDMRDVYKDEHFYHSTLYKECFKPFSIERILSSIHLDERSGIFTLLTLYRYDRTHRFSEAEQDIQNRLLFHLLSCAAHRQLIELGTDAVSTQGNVAALCDRQGIYHAATQQFLDLIGDEYESVTQHVFPINFIGQGEEFVDGRLKFTVQQFGELYKISARWKNQFDDLSAREHEVIAGICEGKTFKQIAKQLSLSPSTVSNHLYRIYLKLGVHTRSELVEQMREYHTEHSPFG